MAEITAALVKELRERTGAGMMDCKKALAEVGADLEKGVEWLRKKGLAAAQKKSSRVAAEGLVGLAAAGNAAVLVEVNAETDFVSRNERFQGFVRGVAGLALGAKGDLEAVKGKPFPGAARNVAEELTDMIATIGENMNLRRAAHLSVEQGAVSTYLHNAIGPGLGKIGVMVALKSAGKAEKLAEVGKQIAMHIAAAAPRARTIAELDPALVEKERSILTEQAQTSGRPADVIAKMVDGRVRKFYEDVVLTEQLFVMDGKTKISAVLAAAGKEAGAPIEIAGFVRFQLGEGLEKKQEDFAQAVADQLKR